MNSTIFIAIIFLILHVPLANAFEFNAAKTIQNACVSCHAVKGAEQAGPTLVSLQEIYKKKYSNEKKFINAMSSFIKKPSIESSLFKEHIKKYGLMPLISLSPKDLTAVSKYLFHANLNDFSKHISQSSKKETPYKKGQKVAQMAKAELGQNLMKALKEKGTAGAVDFCNLKAQSITSDQSKKTMVKIKRATDRPRNPINKANLKELKIIEGYQKNSINGEDLEPILIQEDNLFRFYAPIKINQMCLQCHGQKDIDVKADTYYVIKSKYPNDKALFYKDGDLRGIWSLEWK